MNDGPVPWSDPADAASLPADDTEEPGRDAAGAGPGLGRRRLLGGVGAALFGGGFVAGWLARPTPDDGLRDLGAVEDVLAAIEADGVLGFRVAPDGEEPDHAVVRWDPSLTTNSGDGIRSAMAVYGPDDGTNVIESNPVLGPTTGLMVLFLRSTHRGCRSPYCASSGWFEDPCHGSRWNGWGEWVGGPAPRGLDRRRSEVVDGRLVVDVRSLVPGRQRVERVLQQEAAGPHCVDL